MAVNYAEQYSAELANAYPFVKLNYLCRSSTLPPCHYFNCGRQTCFYFIIRKEVFVHSYKLFHPSKTGGLLYNKTAAYHYAAA